MRTHTHRALAAALTAGVAVALLPAGAAVAQPVQNNDDAGAATAARTVPSLAEAEKNVAAAQETVAARQADVDRLTAAAAEAKAKAAEAEKPRNKLKLR